MMKMGFERNEIINLCSAVMKDICAVQPSATAVTRGESLIQQSRSLLTSPSGTSFV
jgi:hypothetical protein